MGVQHDPGCRKLQWPTTRNSLTAGEPASILAPCARKSCSPPPPPACGARRAAFTSTRPGRSRGRSSPTAIPTTPGRGTSACWRQPRRSPSWRRAWAPALPERPRRSPMASVAAGRCQRLLPPGRACARLGADRGRAQGPPDRRLGRLQAAEGPDLRPLRAGRLRRLHQRGDLRAAGLPPSAAGGEIAKLLASVAQFPERAHLVGAYSLGKAQRVIRMLRDQGYERTIYLHGAMERLCKLYEDFGVVLGRWRRQPSRRPGRTSSPGRSWCVRQARSPNAGRGVSPIPWPASPRAG